MKYFAKYLPVEGEIKPHTFTLLDAGFNNASIVRVMSSTGKYSNVSAGGSNWNTMTYRLKPVKLFLCSRDIQVGNEYYPHSLWFERDKNRPLKYNVNHIMTEYCFKVIGEISSEATWVKEEDEFNDEDIRVAWWISKDSSQGFGSFEAMNISDSLIQFENDMYVATYRATIYYNLQIKGPCSHFH